jgi:nucleoside-triphosphatase THEP1
MKQRAQTDFDAGNEENRRRIEKMSQDQMSNGSSKAGDAEKEIVESVEKIYKMDFIDPVNLSDEIEKLENEIAEFNNNIDYVLSESNSTTYIEVE